MATRTSKTKFKIPPAQAEPIARAKSDGCESARKFKATQDTLGFVSCFTALNYRDMDILFTPRIAQEMCWEDAKAMYKAPKGVDQYSRWEFVIMTFCCGEKKLAEAIMQMTAVYLDYKAGVVSEQYAQKLVHEKVQEISKFLYGSNEQLNMQNY